MRKIITAIVILVVGFIAGWSANKYQCQIFGGCTQGTTTSGIHYTIQP